MNNMSLQTLDYLQQVILSSTFWQTNARKARVLNAWLCLNNSDNFSLLQQLKRWLSSFWQCMHTAYSVTKLCPTLCDSMDYSPPGSSVHGVPQARIKECIAMPSSGGSSWLKSLKSPALGSRFFTTSATWRPKWDWMFTLKQYNTRWIGKQTTGRD